MIRRTNRKRRLVIAIALAAALATWSAPSGVAFDGRSPDTQEAAEVLKAQGFGDARSPDTRDASRQATSDVAIDARSPDTRDAIGKPGVTIAVVGRSPDSSDAAARTPSAPTPWADYSARMPWGAYSARSTSTPPVTARASGDLHWGSFGVGVGVTVGFMLLLAGLAASSVTARDKHRAPTGRVAT